MQTSADYKKCKKIQKADLHVHLNGLFDTELIKEILLEENIIIPEGIDYEEHLHSIHYSRSLNDYLKPWEILRLIPTKERNLSMLIDKAFETLRADHVKYVELRSSVIYLSFLLNKTIEDTFLILLQNLNQASKKRQVDYRLIMTVPRDGNSLQHLNTLLTAYKNLNYPDAIVGLDLAGNENIQIIKGLGKAFKEAKDQFGLKLTVHAGETGNINNIIEAVQLFGADRIGHGIAAAESEKLMDLLAKKNICLEICPISNRKTNAVKDSELLPISKFIKHQVPFVICSDNPGIHKAPLSHDYYEILMETQDWSIIENMYSQQMKYSFG